MSETNQSEGGDGQDGRGVGVSKGGEGANKTKAQGVRKINIRHGMCRATRDTRGKRASRRFWT